MGLVGMYGGVVNQQGIIRSVTAVNQQGQIELIAQNSIITGSNSITESPISTSSATSEASPSSSFGGVINMHGNFANPEDPNSVPTGLIELNGIIYAPSGSVTLNAGNRVFLASGSSIDVSGVWSDETAAALALQVQLNPHRAIGAILLSASFARWCVLLIWKQPLAYSDGMGADFSSGLQLLPSSWRFDSLRACSLAERNRFSCDWIGITCHSSYFVRGKKEFRRHHRRRAWHDHRAC